MESIIVCLGSGSLRTSLALSEHRLGLETECVGLACCFSHKVSMVLSSVGADLVLESD